MNKSELIDVIAKEADLSKASATRALDAVLEEITKQLRKGGDVTLVGFGTFTVAKRQARTGHNPKTKEPIEIPASSVPKFRPGKLLKDAVK